MPESPTGAAIRALAKGSVRRSPVAPRYAAPPHTLHDRVSNVRTSPRTDFLAQDCPPLRSFVVIARHRVRRSHPLAFFPSGSHAHIVTAPHLSSNLAHLAHRHVTPSAPFGLPLPPLVSSIRTASHRSYRIIMYTNPRIRRPLTYRLYDYLTTILASVLLTPPSPRYIISLLFYAVC